MDLIYEHWTLDLPHRSGVYSSGLPCDAPLGALVLSYCEHGARTHELKIYAGARHRSGRWGDMVAHLWFRGETSMRLDLEIALRRQDAAYIDVVDCVKGTTERRYPTIEE